jgi:hypothetical protein
MAQATASMQLRDISNYFRLELPESELFNSELKTILASARDGKLFGENLVKLANQNILMARLKFGRF